MMAADEWDEPDEEEEEGPASQKQQFDDVDEINVVGAMGRVANQEDAADALRTHTLQQAASRYAEKNYKATMILLRKITFTDRDSITLFVDAAYAYWRTTSVTVEGSEKTPAQKEALDSVNNAFTTLLAQKSASSLVSAYEYIRLTHIYLAEGALTGALQILQLASARGHLENTLVVLQSLTILTKLKLSREAEQHITFLITDITLEERSHVSPTTGDVMVQNSPLPMAYVYLHCACYLKRRSQITLDKAEVQENMELCMHMLAEAYELTFRRKPEDYPTLTKWFNSPDLFFDMAVYLEENTPFVLLAEDSYWESFLRSQLSDRAITRYEACMRLTKRGRRDYVTERLELAYKINRWNLYCRAKLLAFEELECSLKKAAVPVYGPRFEDEHFIASVMQGIMRGYLLRNVYWPDIYKRAKKKRDEWLGKVAVAEIAFVKASRNRRIELIKRWSSNARALYILRKAASTRIQACWRRKSGELKLVKRFQRAERANQLFLPLCHKNYDLRRARIIRAWEKQHHIHRTGGASNCLIRVLKASHNSTALMEALHKIVAVIRVLRRRNDKRVFPHWKERYQTRRRKHARVTIRFFFRAQMIKNREKAQEAAMNNRSDIIRDMMATSTTYIYPLKKLMWGRWREELQKKRVAVSRRYVASAVPRVWARQKAWQVVQRKRVRFEIHTSFAMQCLYERIGRSLVFWRKLTAVRRMQRVWRQKLARRAMKRQKNIVATMKRWEERRWVRAYRAMWFRWGKFLYLRMRNRHRQARKITIFFKKIVRNRRVIRATKRKPKAYNLILTFHMIMLTRAFKKMSAGVTGLHTLMVLGPLFLSRWRQCVRLGFSMWQRKHINQTRMLALVRILVTRKTDKRLWHGASESVANTKRLTLAADEFRYRQMLPRAAILMSWERPIKSSEIKYKNMAFLLQYKAFKSMVACYRYRLRLKFSYDNDSGAYRTAEKNIKDDIRCMFKRARDVILLQCSWRVYTAKKQHRLAYLLRLRENEITLRAETKPRWRLFDWMVRRAARMREARVQLQCFYRQWKARKLSAIRRNYLAVLDGCVMTVNRNSKSAKALLAKHLKKMVILYVYSVSGYPLLHSQEALLCSIANIKLRILKALVGPAQGKGGVQDGRLQHSKGSRSNRSLLGKNKAKPILSKSMSLARAPAEDSILSHASMRKSLSNSNSKLSQKGYEGMRNEHYEMNALAAKRIASMMVPQSVDFHAQVFRLRQTGIFVFEAEDDSLGVSEIEYLLRSAQSVFCQNVASHALQQIFVHYKGNKLVLCGGSVNLHDVLGLLRFSAARQAQFSLHLSDSMVAFPAVLALLLCVGSPTAANAVELMEVLCMQSTSARMAAAASSSVDGGGGESDSSHGSHQQTAVSRLSATTRRLLQSQLQSQYEPLYLSQSSQESQALPSLDMRESNAILPSLPSLPSVDLPMSLQLLPSPPPRLNSLACLRELSVDTNSIGALGVATLLANIKHNVSIEVLIVTFSRQTLLPSLGKCIRSMAPNSSLIELRFFGEPFTAFVAQGVYEAVNNGLRGLRHLEYSICETDEAAVKAGERTVNVAKSRLYAGRLSLSVSVN